MDSLAGLERVHVVDPADVDAAGSAPREAAAAVGADQVLEMRVEAAGQEVLVTLRCLAGADATVLWTDGFTAAGDEPELLARAVAARVAAAYPERRRRDGSEAARISPADHQRYLRLAAAIDRPQPGLDEPTILSRLRALRADNPGFLPLYLAEVRVACFLFDSTGTLSYLDDAEDAADGARRAAPEDPRTWAAAWRVALAKGDLEAAAAALDHLEAVDPTDPELPVRRARLAWRRDDPEAAVELLERAMRRRRTWRGLWDLAEIHLHTGDPARARALLQEALELVPGHRIVRAKLAQLELLEGDPRRAASLERALLEEHPSATHATNLGTALLLLGEYEAARETFDEALEMAPDDPGLLLNRADAEALLYGDDVATEWYRRALEAAERLDRATGRESLDIRAQCLAHLGRGLEAVEAVQRQLQRTPDSAGAHFTAALVYAVIGDRTSAVVSAARSIRLGMEPRWFSLPFFASVRDDPAFRAALEKRRPDHGSP
jgi:tetratricopeptide (TPR) repeat protein